MPWPFAHARLHGAHADRHGNRAVSVHIEVMCLIGAVKETVVEHKATALFGWWICHRDIRVGPTSSSLAFESEQRVEWITVFERRVDKRDAACARPFGRLDPAEVVELALK